MKRRVVFAKRCAVVTLAGVAMAGLTSCRSLTPAISVEGHDISIEDLDDEIAIWWANDDYRTGVAESTADADDPIPADFSNTIASQRAAFEVFRLEVRSRDITVSDDDIDQTRQQFESDPLSASILKAFPADFRDRLIRDFATRNRLAAALDDPEATPFDPTTIRVTIDRRYGSWDPNNFAIVAPTSLTPCSQRPCGVDSPVPLAG